MRDLLATLRKRWRYMLVALVVSTASAIAVSMQAPRLYQADATLYVGGRPGDVATTVQSNALSQALVKSYANLVTKKPIAEAVAARLSLEPRPGEAPATVSASVVPETTLITISVVGRDPRTTALIANTTGEVFAEQVPRLERGNSALSSQLTLVNVTLFERAGAPTSPVSPNTKLNVTLGILLGLLVGGAAALLRESLDTSVRTANDVRDLARTTVLGTIAFDPDSAKRPLVVHTDPQSPRAEAVRQVRTNIQFLGIDSVLRSFTVTSALPSEGKSTTSCNLAIALAQSGQRVILVEGDLRKPSVRDYMGIEGSVGLTNVLIGQHQLEDVLQPWGDGTLSILPAGPTPPNPSELLGSHAMAELVTELEGLADIVVFDAPPLLPVTDGAVLAKLTGGALLVVRSGKTKREQVERARELLDNVGARVLGAVVNMAPAKSNDAYAGGYGYGYAADRSTTPMPQAAGTQLRAAGTGAAATPTVTVTVTGGAADVAFADTAPAMPLSPSESMRDGGVPQASDGPTASRPY